jgi:hypothetical protein
MEPAVPARDCQELPHSAFGQKCEAYFVGRPDTEIHAADFDHVTVRSGAGDAVLIDSHRLHQIRPFRGSDDRIAITVHGVEVDRDVWEAWF